MCGIAGFWSGANRPSAPGELLVHMTDALAHRGPDSHGLWRNDEQGIALGHRRLAIVDLSPGGAQPMASSTGRWMVSLNGEIYNYRPLREALRARGHCFRSSSDTEVLLAAVEEWGVEGAIRQCAGMFAIALWDTRERRLYLVRDRLGEKPLYVATMGGGIIFGSELKALRRHPNWVGRIEANALHDFLRFSYVPTNSCIYEDVHKVVPGTIQLFTANDGGGVSLSRVITYWSANDVVVEGARNRFAGSSSALVDDLDSLLRTVIGEEMVADVPLGAFLSGGIDSSLIVALMQQQGGLPVRTFSIGFDIPDYDEAPHAKAVAAHLGTNHTELYVSPRDAMNVVERLPTIYDEPFADSSQIPTFLVSQLARQHVTVSLSGDGGDEVFGGYNRYAWTERLWRRVNGVPRPIRRGAAWSMRALSPDMWDRVGSIVGRMIPSLRMRSYGDKVHKLARIAGLSSREAIYEELLSSWSDPTVALQSRANGRRSAAAGAWPTDGVAFVEQMMLADMVGYMRDDILVKVDRAAMAVSLETRAPFIDHRIVEFAARLPFDMKLRGGNTKWILRELLYRYVPRPLVDRPKMGFGIPVHTWLRTELRGWAESLLDPSRLRTEGFFDLAAVSAVWQSHLAGRINAVPQLWPVLMFQLWLQSQQSAPRACRAGE